jgi:hypothetical protein
LAINDFESLLGHAALGSYEGFVIETPLSQASARCMRACSRCMLVELGAQLDLLIARV